MKTPRLLGLLLLIGGALLAEDAAPLSFDLLPTRQSKTETLYNVLVTNISTEPITLGAERRHFPKPVAWKSTDTYSNPTTQGGLATTFPAFYAETVGKDGKETVLGAKHIKEAIQNPTGNEDSFCTLAPGESVTCEYPIFPNKPSEATFHFLQHRDGKVSAARILLRREASPLPAWNRATGYAPPETDVSHVRLYEVPLFVFGTWPAEQTRLRNRVYDMKAWSAENGLAEDEIDFALLAYRSGLFLISTSEANHLKLKELQFEAH